MSDYDHCQKHDVSFLMPELLMCPRCAVDRLRAGDVPEPLGDALIEAFAVLEVENKNARAADARVARLEGLLRELLDSQRDPASEYSINTNAGCAIVEALDEGGGKDGT